MADDPADAGFYRVANRLGNLLWTRGMRLDRGAGALGAGKASRSRRQAWKPVALGNGTVEFVDRDSGLCLTGQEAAGPGAAGPGVTGQGVTGQGGRGVRVEHLMESAFAGSREQAFSLTNSLEEQQNGREAHCGVRLGLRRDWIGYDAKSRRTPCV